MKTRYTIALLAMAAACISLVPAMAADATDSSKMNGQDHANFGQKGGFGLGGSDDWMLLVDDATKENFENMTLAQIEDLREQKTSELNNMTLAEIKELREQKATEAREKFENMTLGEIKEMRNETRAMGADGMGQMGGSGKDNAAQCAAPQGMMGQPDGDHGFGPAAVPEGDGKQTRKAVGGDN